MRKKATKKAKSKFKWKTDNKMRAYGEVDYSKKLVRVNKKKAKKTAPGELLDTIVHENLHVKHPKMTEKGVKRKTKSTLKKMTKRQKAKMYKKLK